MGRKKQTILTPEVLTDCHVLKYPGKGNVTDDIRLQAKLMIRKHFSQGIIQGSNLTDYVNEHFPGFPVLTINGIILDTIPDINKVQATESRFKFDGMYQEIIDKMDAISKKGMFEKETEQIFALKTTADTIDKYITFMERWGIKPTLVDTTQIEKGSMNVDDMRRITEEVMNKKRLENDKE